MSNWFTWPADLLLGIGGIITSWFVSKAEPSFVGIQTMAAILVLSAVVASVVGGQSVAEFFRLASQVSRKGRHSHCRDNIAGGMVTG